jgi:hypothetical protein
LFLNNRYHDPTLGMFISVDPLVEATADPYLYSSANPITLSDPTGLLDISDLDNIHNETCGNSRCNDGASGSDQGRDSNPNGRSSDASRGRRSDSDDTSSASYDWAGEALFHHYVFGGGDKLWMVDEDDGAWAQYMNGVVFGPIRDGVVPSQRDYYEGAYSWSEIVEWHDFVVAESLAGRPAWNAVFGVATINGEGMVGAQYLHGTNEEVGDFNIIPPSIDNVSVDHDGNTVARLTMRYAWNDRIDPNYGYTSDQQKESIAETIGDWIPVVDPTGYDLRIEWTSAVTYVISPTGQVLSRTGGFFGS